MQVVDEDCAVGGSTTERGEGRNTDHVLIQCACKAHIQSLEGQWGWGFIVICESSGSA